VINKNDTFGIPGGTQKGQQNCKYYGYSTQIYLRIRKPSNMQECGDMTLSDHLVKED
jgi:hypothetical protein